MAEELRVAVYGFEAAVTRLSAVPTVADRDWQHRTQAVTALSLGGSPSLAVDNSLHQTAVSELARTTGIRLSN